MHRTSASARKNTLPELWGGFECTVNRVGDTYMDQLELSGHSRRESDLELLRDLGIKAVRYPVLWERHAPNGFDNIDWSWADRRLNRLRELGIRPIVGLVHHGSGPRHTNLLDPRFPELLAEFARRVAERYPWLDAYTPVNEPLTTARFSCLYGHWYPHLKDSRAFVQALQTEIRATVLAMREIRKINPEAQLIQTEDLGKIYSTPHLQYQADFENQRRWFSMDLLCGRVDKNNPVTEYLGIADDLRWFADNPCQPDIMGFNYYLTSERFLDERTELYPSCVVGGNGRDCYVDVEAVRVLKHGLAGAGTLLAEAWERYQLPLAITELHNGCTREEQARWFAEQWSSAASVREQGIDLRAITAWALLGSHNWNTLVTCDGMYEPGVYELRAPQPLPTMMAELLKQIAEGKTPDHPVLASPGWWRRPTRHIFGTPWSNEVTRTNIRTMRKFASPREDERPILITGRTGTLGRAFEKICRDRGLAHHLLSRGEMDIASLESIENAIEKYKPWAIVNTAGYVRVDDAEVESGKCMRENTVGPSMLAAACQSSSVRLVTFSSDLVFDGSKNAPYVESDPVAPLNVYGRSKAEAESAVLELNPSALVVRTSAFFGPWDDYNFVTVALRALSSGQEFVAISDYVVSPTYVPDLVHCSLDLLLDCHRGIWHLASQGAVTWSELASMAARLANVSTATLVHCKNCEWRFAAVRPRYSVLGSEKASIMPSLESALDRYLRHPDLVWSKAECACEGDVAA